MNICATCKYLKIIKFHGKRYLWCGLRDKTIKWNMTCNNYEKSNEWWIEELECFVRCASARYISPILILLKYYSPKNVDEMINILKLENENDWYYQLMKMFKKFININKIKDLEQLQGGEKIIIRKMSNEPEWMEDFKKWINGKNYTVGTIHGIITGVLKLYNNGVDLDNIDERSINRRDRYYLRKYRDFRDFNAAENEVKK